MFFDRYSRSLYEALSVALENRDRALVDVLLELIPLADADDLAGARRRYAELSPAERELVPAPPGFVER